MNGLVKFSTATLTALILAGCHGGSAARTDPAMQAKNGAAKLIGIGESVDPTAALTLLKNAAEAGNPLAQYYLGTIYEAGLAGTVPDLPAARAAYRQALAPLVAEAKATKNPEAIFALAEMAAHGRGMRRDAVLAQALYAYGSAVQKFTPATGRLGEAYMRGMGVNVDLAQAEKLLTAAADEGYAPANYALYELYSAQKDQDGKAQRALRSAARRDYPAALFRDALEQSQAKSESTRQRGIAQLKRCADGGSAEAALEYALKHCTDPVRKMFYIRQAAYRNSIGALVEMAKKCAETALPDRVMALAACQVALTRDPGNAEARRWLDKLAVETGMLPVILATWEPLNNGADLQQGDVDLTTVILSYKSGAVKAAREEFAALAKNAPEALYRGNAWYRFEEYQLPLEWFKPMFAALANRPEYAAGLLLQYTLMAGAAGDGQAQLRAAQMLRSLAQNGRLSDVAAAERAERQKLNGVVPELEKLPLAATDGVLFGKVRKTEFYKAVADICEANALVLTARNKEAYNLLDRVGRVPQALADDPAFVAMINRFCPAALLERQRFAAATGIAASRLGSYARPVAQKFFSRP